MGLTGALTVGLLEFVGFCVVDLLVAVVVVLVTFLSAWGSVTFVRGIVVFIVGFTGRFSILKKNKEILFLNNNKFLPNIFHSNICW